MKKLKLNIESLSVQSFEAEPGGVVGRDSLIVGSAESGCGPCPTKEATCPKTCAGETCYSCQTFENCCYP